MYIKKQIIVLYKDFFDFHTFFLDSINTMS